MKFKKIILIIISIILILLLLNLIIDMRTKFGAFKEHKEYFDLPAEARHIESWMTLRMINKEFDIIVPKELNKNENFLDSKKTLEEYCKDKGFNTSQVIYELENSRGNVNHPLKK